MPRQTYDPNDGYYEEDYGDDDDFDLDDDLDFAEPGGVSALRRAIPDNPRDCACPTCGHPDRLTRRDVSLGYQRDSCANAVERGWDIDYYERD